MSLYFNRRVYVSSKINCGLTKQISNLNTTIIPDILYSFDVLLAWCAKDITRV